MRADSWEYVIGAVFLMICLAVGIGLNREVNPKPAIGVVRFEGVIDFDTADYLINVFDAAQKDERIAGVVLEILSPGGFATSSESIYYAMLQLRERKPLVVYIDGLAVSGGYLIAVASNRIYVPPSARLGNVGARTLQPGDPAILPEELSTGPYKLSGGSRFDQIRQLELVGMAFAGSVVQQRSNAAANPLQIGLQDVAEARIYLGSEAVALGLADFEGGRSDAIAGAAELAGLTDYQVVDLPDRLGLEPPLPAAPSFAAVVQGLFDQALPDTIFLLDSRISLAGYADPTRLDAHLLSLRAQDHNFSSQNATARIGAPDFLRDLIPAGAATR